MKLKNPIYAEIRKKHTEEALESGERWIVTVQGIPDRQVTTESAHKIVRWLTENATKEQQENIRFHNVISGLDLSVAEMYKTKEES